MTPAIALATTITMLAAIFAAVRIIKLQQAIDKLQEDRIIPGKDYPTLLYVLAMVQAKGTYLTYSSSFYHGCCEKLQNDGLLRKAQDFERPAAIQPGSGATYWKIVTPSDTWGLK